jgi:MFS family permease
MRRAWWIFGVVSLLFFFIAAATFASLGGVLYRMAAELHWSLSAAGSSFALLCLACGLSSPLPAIMMKWVGTRWTMVSGSVTLVVGFGLAAVSHSLWLFLVASGLMGLGFTLTANIPSVYLLAAWFPTTAARTIGFYFMAGALGGVIGPPLVNAIVETSGWRTHWAIMAIAAAVIGVLAALVLKDAVSPASEAAASQTTATESDTHATAAGPVAVTTAGWTPRAAVLTRQFLIIAVTLLVIQTVVTTVHGMIVAHLARLGETTAFGAIVMSIIGLSDSVAKGVSGTISARIGTQRLLVGGILMLCVAVALLAFASSHLIACAFAVVLGIGWGASWLSANLMLLEYFGRGIAAETVATASLITTIAIVGPIAAGRIADVTGTFVPFFYVLAGIMLVTALVCTTLRAPMPGARRRSVRASLVEANPQG